VICRDQCVRNRVRIVLGVLAFPLIFVDTAGMMLLPLWGSLWHLLWMLPLWFALTWLVNDVAFRCMWETYCRRHEGWATDFFGRW